MLGLYVYYGRRISLELICGVKAETIIDKSVVFLSHDDDDYVDDDAFFF